MTHSDSEPDVLASEMEEGGILRLTLNDPARRNALSETMLARLGAAFAAASDDAAVRVVVLAANGAVFSAGHDLKEMTAARSERDGGRAYFARVMAMCSGVMQGIVTCSKPVIAEVGGVATAAGCQLVASCDLAVASEGARFSTPGVHIGLFCSTPMVALSRNVSAKHAMEMLLTGEMTPAARAAEIGLINRVVPGENLRGATTDLARVIASKSSMTLATRATTDLARVIASKSSMTLATGKRAFYEQREMTLPEAYDHASRVMVENMLALDAEEGIRAFIEKREPRWQDA